jgi:hypothetical protein
MFYIFSYWNLKKQSKIHCTNVVIALFICLENRKALDDTQFCAFAGKRIMSLTTASQEKKKQLLMSLQ